MMKRFNERVPEFPPLPDLPDEADRVMFFRRVPGGPRDTVVACRVDTSDLEAIDMLVEAGLRSSRSEAAAWLIHQGVVAQKALLDEVRDTVAQIRKLREEAQAKVGKLLAEEPGTS